MEKRLEATITGLVQGVSFRYYTQQAARKLGLTGWVANLPNGSVFVVAEGDERKLAEFSQFLVEGSPYARVDQIQADWLEATGEFKLFNVRYL